MLGVTDTIAKNEAEYIEIAVRLGLDRGGETALLSGWYSAIPISTMTKLV